MDKFDKTVDKKPEVNFEKLREVTVDEIPSEILATLIEEVRNEELQTNSSYNRYHNRHNRSR